MTNPRPTPTAEHSVFDPGPPRPAEIQPSGDRWTLVFRQRFQHSIERVWSALTEPDQLRAWAPYTADRDLGSVGPAVLITIDSDTPTELDGEVLLAEQPRLLEYRWADQVLRWELTEDAAATEVVLRHTITDRTELAMMAAGWHLCLLAADASLGGVPIGPVVGHAAHEYGWDDLHARYEVILAQSE